MISSIQAARSSTTNKDPRTRKGACRFRHVRAPFVRGRRCLRAAPRIPANAPLRAVFSLKDFGVSHPIHRHLKRNRMLRRTLALHRAQPLLLNYVVQKSAPVLDDERSVFRDRRRNVLRTQPKRTGRSHGRSRSALIQMGKGIFSSPSALRRLRIFQRVRRQRVRTRHKDRSKKMGVPGCGLDRLVACARAGGWAMRFSIGLEFRALKKTRWHRRAQHENGQAGMGTAECGIHARVAPLYKGEEPGRCWKQ